MYSVVKRTFVVFAALLSVLVIESRCSNILGVFPFGIKSHYIMFQSIMTELARRGHNVTVINAFPKNSPQINFTDIDVQECSDVADLFDIDVSYQFHNPFSQINLMVSEGVRMFEAGTMFGCESMKRFLNEDNSFDLIITELFNGDVTLGLVDKFKAPHIAFCAGPIYPWGADRMGNPSNPSYIPYPHTDEAFDRFHPTFYQRLYNTICYVLAETTYFYYSYSAEALTRKALGSDLPPLEEIAKNTSLILSFSHFSLNAPIALVPGVIEVAGVQIQKAKPLPKDFQKFIDESEHGIIYFCMGSLLKLENMPESKLAALIRAFSKLPQRVIWKWDGHLPGKTDRIFTAKWMPQRDILAHPKVKLFIGHGGALGLNEAVYEGVPILGIPIFADQTTNLRVLQAYGAAEILQYTDINNDTVLAKIRQVLQPEYSINMKKVSEIYKDRPMSAMDTAVYWIEYVIRHNGAHHLRTAAVHLPLYQYLLLDVIAFLLTVIFGGIFLTYYVLKKFFSCFTRKPSSDSKKQKSKKNK
ncbi:UDP-glycosyltransferase UGT5-like [Planococcus citri]|uniref:UDP-glycosyltransferase UGT5-like n=1 Tax=Planococcus citri TaxID=170843 RepID=UPI0031FA17E6